MVRRWYWVAWVVAGIGVSGCGGDERIRLTASVDHVELQVQAGPLGTFLAGSFDLTLTLGPEAPGSTTAELESVALLGVSDDAALVSPLPLSEPMSPVELDPGDERTLTLELDASEPIAQAESERLCADQVKIHGSLTDSRSGGESTPFSSGPVTPGGCE